MSSWCSWRSWLKNGLTMKALMARCLNVFAFDRRRRRVIDLVGLAFDQTVSQRRRVVPKRVDTGRRRCRLLHHTSSLSMATAVTMIITMIITTTVIILSLIAITIVVIMIKFTMIMLIIIIINTSIIIFIMRHYRHRPHVCFEQTCLKHTCCKHTFFKTAFLCVFEQAQNNTIKYYRVSKNTSNQT